MSAINRFLLKFLILAVMLLGLPLLGVLAASYPVARYLEFPPKPATSRMPRLHGLPLPLLPSVSWRSCRPWLSWALNPIKKQPPGQSDPYLIPFHGGAGSA